MGRFTVDPDALRSVDVAIDECVVHADQALAALRSSVAGLRWRGAAADDFRFGFEQWVDGIEASLGSLRELGVALGMSAGSYTATEAQVCVAVDRTVS